MANLRIPERYRYGLKRVASLSDEAFARVLAAMESCPSSCVEVADIAAHVAQATPHMDASDVQKIVGAVCSLQSVRLEARAPVERLVFDAWEALQSDGSEDKPAASEQERFRTRLGKMLGVTSLDCAAKALALRVDFGNVFCDAKILTDIRPVFGNPDEAPLAGVITHTLKLVYHADREHREFYVALDLNDIADLKKVLERAESKEKSLAPIVGKVKASNKAVH